jgi:uncharacterized protein
VILLDTSALYALVSRDDRNHDAAVATLARMEAEGEEPVIHTYVLAETFALVHRRRGFPVARRISDELAATLTVVVDRPLHDKGVAWLRSRSAPRSSLVDAVSFVVMGERGIESAFAFDPDFEVAGFRLYRA